MRFNEFKLQESTGFSNRRPGDLYYNPSDENDTLSYQEMILLPPNAEAYNTPEERDEALQKFQQSVNGDVYPLNKPNQSLRGVVVIHMVNNQTKQHEYYVKYVGNALTRAKGTTQIDPSVKAPGHGGYRFGSKVARKEAFKIKPGDVLSSEGPFTPAQVIAQIKAYPNIPAQLKEQMINYLTKLSKGSKDYVMDGGELYQTAHENYTGEYAAPIAVINSLMDNGDVRSKAEKFLLDGEKFSECSIVFPLSTTQKLVDSYLVSPQNRKVGISSKALNSGGAAASLDGLHDVIKKHRGTKPFVPVEKKYSREIDFIETISSNHMAEGMFIAANKFRVISKQDLKFLMDNYNKAKQGTKFSVKQLPPRLQKMMGMTPGAKTDRPNYNPYFHSTQGTAKALVQKLESELDFTGAAKALLNFSSMCQVYSGSTKVGDDDLKLDRFKMVWPPKFEGEIHVDWAKNFTASEIRGRMSFKVPPS